jgi:hypothetical protein
MARGRAVITPKEKDFAKLIVEVGLGPIEAYRKAYHSKCEDKKEQQYAKDLARTTRVTEYMEELKQILARQEKAREILDQSGGVNLERLRAFAFARLENIRDDINVKSATRLQAIKALQQLHDPAKDINLILKWVDVAWRYQKAHCPCCHKDFPLHHIRNKKLEQFRSDAELDPDVKPEFDIERRLTLLKMLDKRSDPHPGQLKALEAPERHIVGTGAARAGKSYAMAMFAALATLLPGVEVWVLARVYDDARSEVEYLKKFFKTLFYPYYGSMVHEIADNKTGELTFLTRWGSELKIKSAKSKGSIIGRELELALIAEPGWVDGEIYEEVRARMSSRLGRIIAFGTPKGSAGIIGRMVRTSGRDPRTGKVIRRTVAERLISNGSPWNVSMLVYALKPEENPAYVQSEMDAARMELSDEEYASEFQGLIGTESGKKFLIPDAALQTLPRLTFDGCSFVLGIDQGPKNFGACLIAYNGKQIIPCYEYFNGDDTTMKANLIKLHDAVPVWIKKLGGNPANWKLTITDRDPMLTGTFDELEADGYTWPTDITLRHLNNSKLNENWRRELQEQVNTWAKNARIIFHNSDEISLDDDVMPGASLLHDQFQNCMDVPPNPDKESKADSNKGWSIYDPWRGDHVVDAAYFALWTVHTGQLDVAEKMEKKEIDPWQEQMNAFKYQHAQFEQQELKGGQVSKTDKVKFEDFFGRKGPIEPILRGGHYSDES